MLRGMTQEPGAGPTGPREDALPREAELLRENEALRARVLVLEARLSTLEESSGRSSPTGQSASMPPPVVPSESPPKHWT